MMKMGLKNTFLRWGAIVSVLFGTACVQADVLLDFTIFNPPPLDQRKIPEPVVRWLIRSDAETFCEKAEPKDGFRARPEGCVYWQRQSSTCTIVTTNTTTHSQLGHLFVHCMKGQ